jgi:hypothetical protein
VLTAACALSHHSQDVDERVDRYVQQFNWIRVLSEGASKLYHAGHFDMVRPPRESRNTAILDIHMSGHGTRDVGLV